MLIPRPWARPQVEKVRNKMTGTKGVAYLEYDPASGRYYELGQGPQRASGNGGGGGGAPGAAGDGGGGGNGDAPDGSWAREQARGYQIDVADAPCAPAVGGGAREWVDDALLRQRQDQDALNGVKARTYDLTVPRDARARGDDESGGIRSVGGSGDFE